MGRKSRSNSNASNSRVASDFPEKMKQVQVTAAKVDSKEYTVPAEVEANISLEATSQQLKTLFKLRDDLQSLFSAANEDDVPKSFAQIVLLSSDFYNRIAKVDEKWKSQLPEEDLPADEDDRMADIRPIRINMFLSSGTLNQFKNNMKQIFSKLKLYEPRLNVYWALNEIFRFSLNNEREFSEYINAFPRVTRNDPKKIIVKCQVCWDPCQANEFCGSFVCGKCKHFFQTVMAEKTLFSLRCGKSNNCPKDDISCRRCRVDRCRKLGMLEDYYEQEMQHPTSEICEACSLETDILNVVRGHLLCSKCEGFFDQTVELNFKKHREKRLVLSNVYECLKDESKCVISPEAGHCQACIWNKMVRLGLDQTYLAKYQGFKPFSPVNFDSDQCAVCDQFACDTQWMKQIVCQPCRSFLQLSLRLESFLEFCCPFGEIGRLCPINQIIDSEDDNKVSISARCKYCWFRRLEIEGLVDRWLICGGKPDLWNDQEEDEEEERPKEPPKKKAKTKPSKNSNKKKKPKKDKK